MNILKEVASISAGYPFRGKIQEIENSAVIVVQMKDIHPDTGINWDECMRTTLTGKRQPDWLMPQDILFVARGNAYHAVQVGDRVEQFQAVASPHLFVIRIKDTDILPEYLAWLLNQTPCQKYLAQNAEGSVALSIRRNVLEETPITIPSLARQKTITQIASAQRQEQQLIEQLLTNSKQMMTALAHDLFEQSNTPTA